MQPLEGMVNSNAGFAPLRNVECVEVGNDTQLLPSLHLSSRSPVVLPSLIHCPRLLLGGFVMPLSPPGSVFTFGL